VSLTQKKSYKGFKMAERKKKEGEKKEGK